MTESTSEGSPTDTARDRARDGVDHLQSAARELINAARAALDVAEHLIDDPEVVSAMVGAAGRLGDVLRTMNPDRSRWPTATDDTEDSDEVDDSGFDQTASTVERITLR
ncbi:MAG: hypothetical protein ACRD2C_19840 [Acidimicrobiales bacterium]